MIGFQNVVSFNKTKILQLFRHFLKHIGQNGKILHHVRKAVERARKIRTDIVNGGIKKLVTQIAKVIQEIQKNKTAIFNDVVRPSLFISILITHLSLAYWSQDKSNQCTSFPNSLTGHISWSLTCKDSTNQKTNCAEYINDAQWKRNPAIVTYTDYKAPSE